MLVAIWILVAMFAGVFGLARQRWLGATGVEGAGQADVATANAASVGRA